ncbi:hypothetical protein [Mesorhizobium sp. M1216]|uniref:hypothetical protein n=1 Tax=Mesorhizobium sp. M1216 TaxID=2957069 RepID=UPI0033392FCC
MGTLDALKKELEAVETEIINLGGGSDQLKAALKELSDITERAGGAFNNSATSAANFKTVLADLKNLVPELKAELDELGKLDAIDAAFKKAVRNATTMSQVMNAVDIANRAKSITRFGTHDNIHQPALRLGGREHGEPVIADLRTHAIDRAMAGPGVVDADPTGRSEPGRQNLLRFGDEGVDLAGQDRHDLTLGDRHAEVAQQRDDPLHGRLTLVIKRQHQTPKLQTEVPVDPVRQRSDDDPAIRQTPAVPMIADHPHPDRQILHHEACPPQKPRARWRLITKTALFGDDRPARATPLRTRCRR